MQAIDEAQATEGPLLAAQRLTFTLVLHAVIASLTGMLLGFDLCIAGGLTEARKIAALCETHMIDVVVHNPIGPVSTAAGLHFNLAIPNIRVHELPVRPGLSLATEIAGQPEWSDGHLLAPTGTGLGLEPDVAALQALGYERRDLPEFRSPDGGFTNW